MTQKTKRPGGQTPPMKRTREQWSASARALDIAVELIDTWIAVTKERPLPQQPDAIVASLELIKFNLCKVVPG